VFVYLNNSFAPGPDEIIGNLYKVSWDGFFFGFLKFTNIVLSILEVMMS
jgi:hypothetical protein